jgi:hypothetical protein
VAGSVASLEDALALTADQQTAIGFFCGGQFATRDVPLTRATCTTSNYGATRLRIPAEGTADDVANPPRVAPRHLFDLGVGADNLLHTDRTKLRVRFSVINLTNKDALYNFLSTFSGTHFVTPRVSGPGWRDVLMRRRLNQIAVSDRGRFEGLTQFPFLVATRVSARIETTGHAESDMREGGFCAILFLTARNSLILKRRDVGVVDRARLESERPRPLSRTDALHCVIDQ